MTVQVYKPLSTISIAHKFQHSIHIKNIPLLSRISHRALFDHVHQAVLEYYLYVSVDSRHTGASGSSSGGASGASGSNNDDFSPPSAVRTPNCAVTPGANETNKQVFHATPSLLLKQLGDPDQLVSTLTLLHAK
jgi:hypothetical protein